MLEVSLCVFTQCSPNRTPFILLGECGRISENSTCTNTLLF